MRKTIVTIAIFVTTIVIQNCGEKSHEYVEISSSQLQDKIQGGFLGQLLGNLNGIQHENKYIAEPGSVSTYTPVLPTGAWSDDDTDIEWVYITAMLQYDNIFLSSDQIAEPWMDHINDKIWSSNNYVRGLLDLGIKPPYTGRIAINPWAKFNIADQFTCESFGLIAPIMPQIAAQIGLHYTHVAIDGEPAQATQLLTTMIAQAFIENNIEQITKSSLNAVDPESAIKEIVITVLNLWNEYPNDWQKTRDKIKQKYTHYSGGRRDNNGYELNSASIIASVLYGKGDFVETLRLAFNFGWDADCNAATCGTILGIIKGKKWMSAQGWEIKDIYRNVTREGMPDDETITTFGDRLVSLARKIILLNGVKEYDNNGEKIYIIKQEKLKNMEPLLKPLDRLQNYVRSFYLKLKKI
jgi:hypothetical protein